MCWHDSSGVPSIRPGLLRTSFHPFSLFLFFPFLSFCIVGSFCLSFVYMLAICFWVISLWLLFICFLFQFYFVVLSTPNEDIAQNRCGGGELLTENFDWKFWTLLIENFENSKKDFLFYFGEVLYYSDQLKFPVLWFSLHMKWCACLLSIIGVSFLALILTPFVHYHRVIQSLFLSSSSS